MKLKCILGRHEWQKLGGSNNVGGGKFKQAFKCQACQKVKYHIS